MGFWEWLTGGSVEPQQPQNSGVSEQYGNCRECCLHRDGNKGSVP